MQLDLQVLRTQHFVHPIGPKPTPQHTHRVIYDLQWIRSQNQEPTDLGAMLAHIDAQLTTLIDNHLHQHHTQPHDRVGLILEIEGDDRRYGRTTKLSENPLKVLFDFIRALLQSNDVLALKKWTITVDIFRNPTGGVIRRVNTVSHRSVANQSKPVPKRCYHKPKKPSFLLQVQEVDAKGCETPMSDDSESESGDNLSDFVVSDDHLSADEANEHVKHPVLWMSDTDSSSSSESETDTSTNPLSLFRRPAK